MLKNFNLKKITGKFFRKRSRLLESGEINPSRDWNIILIFFAMAIVVLIIFGSYMYWEINKGDPFVFSDGDESPVETIDRAELKRTAGYYEAKNRLFEENKLKKPKVIDPSL